VTGEWRKLHSYELHNLYSPPNIIRQSNQGERGGWDIWQAWERKVYKVLVGKTEGKRPLGRPRHR
jgi:hypothetical protein